MTYHQHHRQSYQPGGNYDPYASSASASTQANQRYSIPPPYADQSTAAPAAAAYDDSQPDYYDAAPYDHRPSSSTHKHQRDWEEYMVPETDYHHSHDRYQNAGSQWPNVEYEYQDELYDEPQDYRHASSSQQQQQQNGPQQWSMRGGGRQPSLRHNMTPKSPGVMDTPSAYSDPYDWQSDVGGRGGGMNSYPSDGTLNGAQGQQRQLDFLNTDPYARNGQGGHGSRLTRNNTIGPNDSISAYNVPYASSRVSAAAAASGTTVNANDGQYGYPSGRYSKYGVGDADDTYGEDEYQTFRATAPGTSAHSHGNGGKSSFAYETMGYADDEDEQTRQMKHQSFYGTKLADGSYAEVPHAYSEGPALFSNQLAEADPAIDTEGKKALDDSTAQHAKKDLLGFKSDPLERQIEKRRRGIGRQRWPVMTWVFSVAFVGVFIAELIKAKQETGQAVQTKPSVNPMIGPSSQFLISFGARFTPCMKALSAVPTTTKLACLNASTLSSITTSQECSLWEICGLPSATAVGQYYRFVTPIFLHAGFLHILFNLLVQLTLCAQIEKLIGSPFYVLLYMAGGVGGNLLGANFGLIATPSVGASGSIYTCISIELVDLIYNWKYEYRVKTRIAVSIFFTIFGLGLGLLPGIDNLAHISGLAVGLLGGMIFCPSIHTTPRHRIIIWSCRVIALVTMVVYFVMLTLNFINNPAPQEACKWCRYLSCLPVFSQCKNNGLAVSNSGSSGSSRRDLFLL